MFIRKLIITLENIRGIKKLVFEAPTKSGVYVMTGINGSGKSTLMTAMARISDNSIFSSDFVDTPFDSYGSSKISYHMEKEDCTTDVYFTRSKSKWNPHPKNCSLGKAAPFEQVIYINTSTQRFFEWAIKTQPIEKTEASARSASPILKAGLKEIIGSDKFEKLKYQTIKNIGAAVRRPKRGNKVFYIPRADGSTYSELNFSLGERMILNALDALENVKERSLLLIDEIELALHPIVQINFFDYVKRIAKEKNLMVIISTHSPSLIRYAKNRYFLESDKNGIVEVKSECLPSYILRDLTIESENNPDYLLFVEDEQAMRLLNVIISIIKNKENCTKYFTYRIIRVGGWEETIRLMSDFKTVKPYSDLTVKAFPDLDAKQAFDDMESKDSEDRTDADKRRIELWKNNLQNILPLHITPELGIWNWILSSDASVKIQEFLEREYGILTFKIKNCIDYVIDHTHNGSNEREQAKYKLMDLVTQLVEHLPAIRRERAYDLIYSCYVEYNYEDIKLYYKQFFCKILNSR